MIRPIRRYFGGLRHTTKRNLKRLIFWRDLLTSLVSTGKGTQPPRWLRFDSASDYDAMGQHLFQLLRRFGSLQLDSQVLDIGCGVGRLAKPLIANLDDPGSYDGFDVDLDAIRWCESNLAHSHRKVRFIHIDAANSHYNRNGKASAGSLRFPYDDDSFDRAVAISLFTHLMPNDAQHYLHETARVLREDGILVTTWFLVGSKNGSAESEAEARFSCVVEEGIAFTDRPRNPCAAIAYSTEAVKSMFTAAGLDITAGPFSGQWRGVDGPTSQDLIVAQLPRS